MCLKKEVKAAEEKLREAAESEAASREVAIIEARHHAIKEFKQSEEFKTFLDMGYDDGYDKAVEEIFFNIWHKHRKVDFKFLGKEFQTMMADWEDQEKRGELDARPPPSPEDSDEDCTIIGQEPADNANTQVTDVAKDANNPAPNA